jgi:predicted ATPase/class 3 adenylate cyclase
MAELPVGTVTFLFTDLEGSTRLWEEHPAEMRDALARHDAILRDAIEAHHGQLVKTTGDGAHAAFSTASDAIDAAVAAQLALHGEEWDATPLRVRMGIHTGAAEIRDGDYYGTALNRAARLTSVAHGGQIVVSLTTRDLLRDTPVDLLDLGEHRLRDLGEPERIHQVAHSELPRDFPPLRSVENFPTNLPLQTTSFVGRDDDMDEVMDALESARVVTLTGVGGVGKTRLAIQVAAELLPRLRDGAWLVELGPLNTPDGLPELLAAALSIQPRQGMTTAQGIVDALRTKEMLVVLDNCEHVIGAAARMVDDIVRSCPGVRILATSREGLGVRGERQITVRSLDLAVESVQLFVERARDAGGRFEHDEATESAVAQICTRLDGIPLALELAAARTRMMTPAEVATRLDERFRLLTGGSRTAVERHQTLRQAVDWSYDLLEPRERTMLDRLGVFAGGFTLDAAEAVVSGDGVDALDVMDGIAQLVDKSLVVAEQHDGGTRYRLLETIRQYALERLEQAGSTDTVRRRHAEWCAAFIEEASLGVRSRDELHWLARLRRELDNLRAGITWAAGTDDADLALRQLGDLNAMSLSQRTEGYRLCPLAAVALSTSGAFDHALAARALMMRAVGHLHGDELDDAGKDALEAVRLMREGTSPLAVEPWIVLMLTRTFRGVMRPRYEDLDLFMRAAEEIADPYTRCSADGLIASWLFAVNEPDEALPYAESAMELAHQLGNPTLSSMACFALGGALMHHDPRRAREVLLEGVELGRLVGNDFFVGVSLGRIARLGADASDAIWARQFREALDMNVENDDRRNVAVMLDVHSQALVATGQYDAATILFGYVQAHARHVTNPYSQLQTERIVPILRDALGEDQFGSLRTRGAGFEQAEAVALSRAELDRVIEGVPSDP